MVVNVVGYGTFIAMNWRKYPIVVEVEGFKRIYSDHPAYGYWYPFAVKRAGARLRGILMHEADDSLLEHWDRYEGYPALYDRVVVQARVVADRSGVLSGSGDDDPPTTVDAWLYVPSSTTESLRLDKVYKEMKSKDRHAYEEMFSRDIWLEKLLSEHPEIADSLPELFE